MGPVMTEGGVDMEAAGRKGSQKDGEMGKETQKGKKAESFGLTGGQFEVTR